MLRDPGKGFLRSFSYALPIKPPFASENPVGIEKGEE
jgi:hypothetical protein